MGTLTQTGNYDVYIRFPSGPSRSSTTNVIIQNNTVNETVIVDQKEVDGKWVSVGTYNFTPEFKTKLIITNANSNGHVIVDAVAFVPKMGTSTSVKLQECNTEIVRIIPYESGICIDFNSNSAELTSIEILNSNGITLKKYANFRLDNGLQMRNFDFTLPKSGQILLVKFCVGSQVICKKLRW